MNPLSLRARLIALISMLLCVGMLLGVAFQVLQAKRQVSEELQAAAELAFQLLDAMLGAVDDFDAGERELLLARLQGLAAVRHLDIRFVVAGEPLPPVTVVDDAAKAPRWFEQLVAPAQLLRQRTLTGSNDSIVIRSNAGAEIGEVWQSSRMFLIVLGLVLVTLNGFLYVVIGRWLAPVNQIVDSLEHAEQGDFSVSVPVASLPELRTITDKLNQLTLVLRKSQAENERLASLSLQIQEDERHNLARELHDEMGQSLSAIKAIAWSLQQRTSNPESPLRQGAERISAIAASMSGHVRSMLGRLRPVMLDELGLVQSLQLMVEQWNEAHRGCECALKIAPAFAEVMPDLQIHVYRIVQEGLTNIARYAGARQALVLMQAQQDFRIVISDDGKGFDVRRQRLGIGLTVMRERCQALGGQMQLDTTPGAGVRISITFPRHVSGES